MKGIKNIDTGKELSAALQEEGDFAPDGLVPRRVEHENSELAEAVSLPELMSIIGRRAQVRGLTQEILDEILKEK